MRITEFPIQGNMKALVNTNDIMELEIGALCFEVAIDLKDSLLGRNGNDG